MQQIDVQIEPSWKHILFEEFQKPYFLAIRDALKREKSQGIVIYPPGPLIFHAFQLTPFDKVKVVLLGQDPYHGAGQAHGLCFSVPEGIPLPPSLQNIFKELHDDVGCPVPRSGNLTAWAQQGVLLLNAMLTVRANQPASHHHIGWHWFTDAVIKRISELKSGVVFLLWGKYAHQKEDLIDLRIHYVLKAAHPSPLSATNGFFGCRHFSKTNELLMRNGHRPIQWCLS